MSQIINIPIQELLAIQNYSQVCERLGIKEPALDEYQMYRGHDKKFFAFFRLKTIEKLFNSDWVANWNNASQYKYYPYFYKDGSTGWVYGAACTGDGGGSFDGSVAYFRSKELALHVGTIFKDIYLDLIV